MSNVKEDLQLLQDGYLGHVFGKTTSQQKRIMIGIPMTGLVRAEWAVARYGQIIPCNWSQVEYHHFMDQWSPLNFLVADARNVISTRCVEEGFEWLFFIDHDTIIPPFTMIRVNDVMLEGKIPVWAGLYFTKSVPSEPLIYRGRGNGYFPNWKMGEKVWVDGIPMGCTLIHSSILRAMYQESEEYIIQGLRVRRIFNTPSKVWFDPELNQWFNAVGTEDLDWCDRVIKGGYFKKAGWPEYQDKEFPFVVDTGVFCRHIETNGTQYPALGEEGAFIDDGQAE